MEESHASAVEYGEWRLEQRYPQQVANASVSTSDLIRVIVCKIV